jgi:CubicO group peptidase (beta-lactamase class C family)
MTFLEAFFDGRLVAPEVLVEMQQEWHPIFFPLEYGTGLMRFRVRRYFSPVVRVPPFVGHSGASGVVMYRCPERGLSIVGTVNQVESRSLPYQLMVRSAIAAGRR